MALWYNHTYTLKMRERHSSVGRPDEKDRLEVIGIS
jgi:hypothetical protein